MDWQRIVFRSDAELLLIPTTDSARPDSMKARGDAWINLCLHNFTGRLILQPIVSTLPSVQPLESSSSSSSSIAATTTEQQVNNPVTNEEEPSVLHTQSTTVSQATTLLLDENSNEDMMRNPLQMDTFATQEGFSREEEILYNDDQQNLTNKSYLMDVYPAKRALSVVPESLQSSESIDHLREEEDKMTNPPELDRVWTGTLSSFRQEKDKETNVVQVDVVRPDGGLSDGSSGDIKVQESQQQGEALTQTNESSIENLEEEANNNYNSQHHVPRHQVEEHEGKGDPSEQASAGVDRKRPTKLRLGRFVTPKNGAKILDRAANLFSAHSFGSHSQNGTVDSSEDQTEGGDISASGHGSTTRRKFGKNSSSKLNQLIYAHKVQSLVSIPAYVRKRRQERVDKAMMRARFPTRLHELCASPDVALPTLMDCLESDKQAASVLDDMGRTPLHILGDNEQFISAPRGKHVATSFASRLIEAFPDALTTVDKHGFMPFVMLIAEWVQWTFETHLQDLESHNRGTPMFFGNQRSGEKWRSFFPYEIESTKDKRRMFPHTEVWEEIDWCFSMLSLGMDALSGMDSKSSVASMRAQFSNQCENSEPASIRKEDRMRREIANHLVTKVPDLIKCVLLVETDGGETRRRILRLPIFRRIFLRKEAIGDWITIMLRRPGHVAERAVDFLELISSTKVADYAGDARPTSVEDVQAFQTERDEVFDAVNKLDGTMGSLVTLDNRETERAAATSVIWKMLEERLERPFVLALVLIDLVLHIALMLSFRNSVQIGESRLGYVPNRTVYFIVFHYILRKACESMALLSISPAVFRGYVSGVWTMFDMTAICMTTAAFIWNERNPGEYRNGVNAFVIGLLWMKVLGILKVVNKDMSTFILALIEILNDIRNFLFVLGVVILMFGDMLHVAVSTKDNGMFCNRRNLEGPTEDFCSTDTINSYLRVYSMLLGDFEVNDLRDTMGITVLYVIFTSVGVVILLNVLIAVISDSYERATISSTLLFGRARATFVAQHEALEAFLRPAKRSSETFQTESLRLKLRRQVFALGRWSILLTIIGTAADAAYFLFTMSLRLLFEREGGKGIIAPLFLFSLFVILASALGVLVGYTVQSCLEIIAPGSTSSSIWMTAKRLNISIVRRMSSSLFGLSSESHRSERQRVDEWSGRLNFIRRMVKEIVNDSQKEVVAEMTALETRLYEHDLAMRDMARSNRGNLTSR